MSEDINLRGDDGTIVFVLNPRHQRALRDLIASQVMIDDGGVFPDRPSALERDEAMHGARLPVQDGKAVIYPIACRAAVLAERRDDELPQCRWVADGEGVACTRCGKAEGPGMARRDVLLPMVEGTYMPEVSPSGKVSAEGIERLCKMYG